MTAIFVSIVFAVIIFLALRFRWYFFYDISKTTPTIQKRDFFIFAIVAFVCAFADHAITVFAMTAFVLGCLFVICGILGDPINWFRKEE